MEENSRVGDGLKCFAEVGDQMEQLPRNPETESKRSEPRLPFDAHLGKGTIKPQAVEMGPDGFHFKYDVPLRGYGKPEPVRDQPRSYRFTAREEENQTTAPLIKNRILLPQEDFETKALETLVEKITFEDCRSEDEETINLEPEESGTINPPVFMGREAESELDSDERNPEVTEESFDRVEIVEPLVEYQDTIGNSSVEKETIWENEKDKAEFEDNNSTPAPYIANEEVIIWEGRQSWFGIPLPKYCRITEQMVTIVEEISYRLIEVDLELITGVVLNQSWWDRIIGIGNLILEVGDYPEPRLLLKGIREPEKVLLLLNQRIALSLQERTGTVG